jgi:1-acyl-sn-glycerol-3-phosphate acyltransferase
MTTRAHGRRGRDRVIAFVARMIARAFFRSVEDEGERPSGGRVILAASHLNGFVDPVLLVASSVASPGSWRRRPCGPCSRRGCC